MAPGRDKRAVAAPRQFQFTIRTMLVVTTAVALFFGLLHYAGGEFWRVIAPNGLMSYAALLIFPFSWHAARVRNRNSAYCLVAFAWNLILLDTVIGIVRWWSEVPICGPDDPQYFFCPYNILLVGIVLPWVSTIPVIWVLLARQGDPLQSGTKWCVLSTVVAFLNVLIVTLFTVGITTVRLGADGVNWATFLVR